MQIACCLSQKWLISQNPGHKYDRLHQEIIDISKDVMNRLTEKEEVRRQNSEE